MKNYLINISIVFLTILLIVIVFRMCKCSSTKHMENFVQLEDKLSKKKLANQLSEHFTTSSLATKVDILEQKALEFLQGITDIKKELKLQTQNTDVMEEDDLLEEELTIEEKNMLNELASINQEIEKDDDDEEEEDINNFSNIENDDLVEGFIEKSTSTCSEL